MKKNSKTLTIGLASLCTLIILSVAEASIWKENPLSEERAKEVKDAVLKLAFKGKLYGIKGVGLEHANIEGEVLSFQEGFPMPNVNRGFPKHIEMFNATNGMARTVMCPERWCAVGSITPIKKGVTKFKVIAMLGKDIPRQKESGESAFFYPKGYYSHGNCGVKYTVRKGKPAVIETLTKGC